MRAIAVQPDALEPWHERLKWHFNSFCKDGSITMDDLWSDIEWEQRQLWVLEDEGDVQAVILTSVTLDRLKTCEVTHAAGKNRKKWQHLFGALEHWAREIGCQRIRATARPGWARILPLKQTHVVLERRL